MSGPFEWKVGQEVLSGERVLKIERVTPSGLAVIGSITYDRYGFRRGQRGLHARDCIEPYTAELAAQITERHAVRAALARWRKIEDRLNRALPAWRRDATISSDALNRLCDAAEAELNAIGA